MKKTSALRKLIFSKDIEFLMEAHNGLSARIVEEAGFQGIWASGLAISASLGVRDNNEASWTQIMEVLEFMSDAVSIPILHDGDTGYGNFNNARRRVKKLETRGIAGVCIEDKLFPKTNSFITGKIQPLADIDEFCGKIRAMKDSQTDNDFVVVARVEAFIAGYGLKEALNRAEAYKQAGADAILIHSKKTDFAEIETFMKEWGNRLPVIIVPTTYFSTPTDKFRELGVSVVIWANHTLRAAISAMQKTVKQIREDNSLFSIEGKIVSLTEVFRIQGAEELQEAEKIYLPSYGKRIHAVILSAGQGDLGDLTRELPKSLLKVNGKTILRTQMEEFAGVGIKDITVVRGFDRDKFHEQDVLYIDNDDYASTKDLYSLYLAKEMLTGDIVVCYGDILFKTHILHDLLNDKNDITVVVDSESVLHRNNRDFVTINMPAQFSPKDIHVKNIGGNLDPSRIHGEFIGLWKTTEKGSSVVLRHLEQLSREPGFRDMTIADLINRVSAEIPVAVRFIRGGWLDINTIVDLQKTGDI